jgi:hypothetical protein
MELIIPACIGFGHCGCILIVDQQSRACGHVALTAVPIKCFYKLALALIDSSKLVRQSLDPVDQAARSNKLTTTFQTSRCSCLFTSDSLEQVDEVLSNKSLEPVDQAARKRLARTS